MDSIYYILFFTIYVLKFMFTEEQIELSWQRKCNPSRTVAGTWYRILLQTIYTTRCSPLSKIPTKLIENQ